ncbi:MAG: hypothetical protein HY049_14580 [Acidobacteria bacterium]|nr:hypothetical protein [Acidobacteriota bacterium]
MTPADAHTRPRALQAILGGGLVVAVLDGVNATLFWALYRGTEPHVIFQSIASGLLGQSAFSGGTETAALGAFLHLFIAMAVAAVFYLGCTIWPVMLRWTLTCGLVYGAVVYLVMNFVVVPLSQARPVPFNPAWFLDNFLGHLLLVGPPVAFVTRWSGAANTSG